MLALTRKPGQRIQIGESVVVTVVRVRGNSVILAIEAPPEVSIVRDELVRRPRPLAASLSGASHGSDS